MAKRMVGKVSHWYPKAGVAVLDLESDLRLGDEISFEGPETDLQQAVESMQVDGKPVEEARAGSQVAVKVNGRVRPEDHVYFEARRTF